MKAFRFPLEKVLDWRRSQLEAEERKLREKAGAVAELDRARAQLEAAGLAAESEVREWSPLAGADLAALDGFHRYVRDEARKLALHRTACAREMEAQRSLMLEARRRCRLLERLRERRLAGWNEAAARETDDLAAESFLARYCRTEGQAAGGRE